MKNKMDYEAECNECEWCGNIDEMDQAEDDDRTNICPCCGSEDIYYLK